MSKNKFIKNKEEYLEEERNMELGNNGNKILLSEILEQFQEALLQGISSSKLGISISNANSIIIEEYAKMYPKNKGLNVDQAVKIREEIIKNGTVGIGDEFVKVKNGKFKPLVILS